MANPDVDSTAVNVPGDRSTRLAWTKPAFPDDQPISQLLRLEEDLLVRL